MEVKSLHKIASVSLLLMGLLLGSGTLPLNSSVVSAQTSESPTPSTSADLPNPTENPASVKDPNDIPLLLWIAIGGLGLWSAILSFTTFRTIKWCDEKVAKNDRKIKDLEAKNLELDGRIGRRTAAIEELKGQLMSYKKTLEVIQLQSQPGTKLNPASYEAKQQPSNYGYNKPSSNPDYAVSTPNYAQSTPAAKAAWDRIVQNFNSSPQVLEGYIVESVAETEESVNNRRGNSKASVLLKAASNYSYWIFTGDDRGYWLTPKADLKINPVNFDTFQALFESQDYQPGSKVYLVKPAKVAQNSQSGAWELLEKGQVQFAR
ncbi:MAG: hypothetical protein HC852_10150 [Acaryochloridaceae cyanobacterium RU_4_10]|nr:hypothetical protein [Acaryochloridaceae cyanobacterium RU_4_10]